MAERRHHVNALKTFLGHCNDGLLTQKDHQGIKSNAPDVLAVQPARSKLLHHLTGGGVAYLLPETLQNSRRTAALSSLELLVKIHRGGGKLCGNFWKWLFISK